MPTVGLRRRGRYWRARFAAQTYSDRERTPQGAAINIYYAEALVHLVLYEEPW
jgi:hypothetical protein